MIRCSLCHVGVLVAALALTAGSGCQVRWGGEGLVSVSSVRLQHGDDPAWAAPAAKDDARDDDWQAMRLWDVPGAKGIFWLRGDVTLRPETLSSGGPLGINFSAMATCQIYWDGILLPGGERPGATPEDEIPAPIDRVLHLPDRLATPGKHLVAARCSTHHRHFEPTVGFYGLVIGPYDILSQWGRAYSWQAMASLTAKLLAAVIFGAMFLLTRRRTSDLLLAVLGIAAAALLITESWRMLVGYTYNWHLLRLLLVTGLAWLVNVLLVLVVLTRFPMRRRGVLLVVVVSLLTLSAVVVPPFDFKVGAMFLVGLSAVTSWVLYAAWRRRPGSRPTAVGLLVCLGLFMVEPSRFLDQGVFFALDFLLGALLVAHVMQVRREEKALEAARLRAARLEAELLQRSLQPHFLLNTLTALAEHFEEDPTQATGMLEGLAEELRLLGELAERPMVTVAEELALCRSHLQVMRYRKECDFQLIAEGIDTQAEIPPGVFHTLIENAITHNYYKAGPVVFQLRRESTSDGQRYCFEAPLGASGATRPAGPSGTGLRYVRARLAEAFGDDFHLASGPGENVWRTEIRIP